MITVEGSIIERVEWADVLKGLGILAVVWGHSGSKNAFYMFWFHMPLFFFISGYLYRYKPLQNEVEYVKKKVCHLLIPYGFYLMLLALMMFSVSLWKGQSPIDFWSSNWKAFLLGGSLLEGVYATFWFTTCLFFTQIFYDLILRNISSQFLRGLIILVCFLAACWESRYWMDSFVPWNMDVGLYGIVFYALGHYFREKGLLEQPTAQNLIVGVSFLISIAFIYLYSQQIVDYGLDMKHRQYYYWGWNLILPLVFTLVLVKISLIVTKWKAVKAFLTLLGRAAMVIMYLHLPSVYVVGHFMAITPFRFFIIGIVCPLLFYQVVGNIPYGSFLALGEPLKKKYNSRAIDISGY
ncbi:acetyltransferase, fucose-4-O-acetylase [Desulfosporosinus orientis DSM 765]|uniref:Acetyltransferase, fucose-4-O-acetylase n=1 Tax=Desulfosporosinus orientis (strain ATCC 19365 / DSM 765 / NCIMB 8382 / VKM B-1628 / Singapore I) TaxID=768706 RepID=G7WCA1_DESOD|nr:acyltransferase family protein [Desulfosporosinus orientis]AET70719.1 acetyltransferase, fucose-4-O-acetylase [Desulfosporosinus orientis DSM 765]